MSEYRCPLLRDVDVCSAKPIIKEVLGRQVYVKPLSAIAPEGVTLDDIYNGDGHFLCRNAHRPVGQETCYQTSTSFHNDEGKNQ